jgi:hypothetical protein
MNYIEFKDYLFIRRNKEIKSIVKNEQILLSAKTELYYFFNFSNTTNIIITGDALYIFNKQNKKSK